MPPVATYDEQEIRHACEKGDFRAATTTVIEDLGPEILGYLRRRLPSASDAAEAFSLFAVDLWQGLPRFQWRCTLLAWAYRIARHAALRWASAGARRPERNLSLERAGIFEVAERVRSSTLDHLRTEMKSEVRRLREELAEPDQMLLILRIDRSMEWREVAAALADDDLAGDELERETARLRQRFQFLTKKLRELARERGLLDR
jgi:RNA polymerase sigma factor (sigma-70 family)